MPTIGFRPTRGGLVPQRGDEDDDEDLEDEEDFEVVAEGSVSQLTVEGEGGEEAAGGDVSLRTLIVLAAGWGVVFGLFTERILKWLGI